MYECKDCRAEFSTPVLDFRTAENLNEVVSYCPKCMSVNIRYLEVCFCAFCGRAGVPKGEVYCNDICKRLGEEFEDRMAERRKKIKDFEITKAVSEVEEYNRAHGTDYSYGKYFALKGLGGLNDD